MQTIGTVLVAVRQRSVVRMWMLALSSPCAHGLLYVTAVRRRTCQKDRSQVDGPAAASAPQALAP
jgi:hypothetical protein